jgi:hypothetical protein
MSDQVKTVVEIDRAAASFNANGKEYFIETKLSVNRWQKYQEFELEVGYGMSAAEMNKRLGEAVELLNKVKFVDAAVLLNSLATGITKIKQRAHPVFRLCALFMNTKDEDRTDITDELIMEKVNDWKAAGIDAGFFLAFAQTIMLGSITNLESKTQGVSEEQQSEKP